MDHRIRSFNCWLPVPSSICGAWRGAAYNRSPGESFLAAAIARSVAVEAA